jgi:hypothetical protein
VFKTSCFLCGAALKAVDDDLQEHPSTPDCDVRHTDAWGVAITQVTVDGKLKLAIDDPEQYEFQTFPFVDVILEDIFAQLGLPRLGGMSTGRGWSSFSTFQRCPYAWRRKYVDKIKPAFLIESPSLAIGSLVHTFLAVFYTQMIDSKYPLTPEAIYDHTKAQCNPEFVDKSWRMFVGYRLYFKNEKITPLAVEHDLKDPRTGESCRYDLVAFFAEWENGRAPGTYIIEHKTASRFDADALDGWVNDGEVIGEVALWKHLGLDLRFGKLKGVIVNLLGKHKEPQFHRTIVAPESWQIEAHLDDLRRWEGLIQLSRSSNNFPRSRNGCIGRYGRCDYFDHCATGE